MRMETKNKGLQRKLAQFWVQMRIGPKKKRSSPQIGRVFRWIMVLHHKFMSLQNGDTWRELPPKQCNCSKHFVFIYSSQLSRFHVLLMAELFATFMTPFR